VTRERAPWPHGITPERKPNMATNTDKPVGPGTFTRGGNSVTIAEDGKILVRKDDWLSKYSWALYGDYKTLDVFVRPNPPLVSPTQEIKGIKEIEDVNRIKTGEYLIHVPTYFYWAEKRGRPRIPRARPNYPQPMPEAPGNSLDSSRLQDFLRFLRQWLSPVTDWKFVGSGGVDISAAIFTAHYCRIGVQRTGDPAPTWFHAVGAGLGLGPEDIEGSITLTPPDLPSVGCIAKTVLAGRTLSLDEICGNYLLLDLSGGCFLGGSIAVLFFGFNTPPDAVLRNVVRYFRGEGSAWPILPSLCHGAVFMAGLNLPTPSIGVSIKVGWMHRWECVTG
jgi:hypothetical protein